VKSLKSYFAEIGRRGGIRSRRTLDPETARRMVVSRERRRMARHIATRSHNEARPDGTPADTVPAVQAIQDELTRRLSPAAKLAQVERLSRMVDQLAIQGLRVRNPDADDVTIRYLRAELRLGRDLAADMLRKSSARA
jgi:hypothetical protein